MPGPISMSHTLQGGADATGRWIRGSLKPSRLAWRTGVTLSPLGGDRPSDRASDEETGPFEGLLLTDDGSTPGVVLDFGREVHGGVAFRVGDTSPGGPVRVRVRFGESVTEAMGEALCQQICSVEPGRTYEVGGTGFRFVRLDLIEGATSARLDHVRALLVCRDLEFKGAFRCNDEKLNQVWQAGADTVHLCLQDHLWDGVKRDRQVWAGDMHPAAMVVNAVFGELAVVRQSLDLVRDETPLGEWMNGISAYSIWWVLIHRDWYLHHGDWAFLDQQRGYLRGLIDHLTSRIHSDGREDLDGWRFLDWGSCGDDAAIHAGMQALLVLGLEAGAELFRSPRRVGPGGRMPGVGRPAPATHPGRGHEQARPRSAGAGRVCRRR
jgi:alpha-L-rhamnosidase